MAVAVANVDAAWKLLSAGDFQGAATVSRKVLETSPNDVSALCCGAMANWQLGGDINQSLGQIRRAAQLAPDVAPIQHNLGTLLASNGEIDAACVAFERALAIKPDDAEAFHGLASNHKFREETPLVRQMMGYYSSGQFTERQQEFVCFALAKVYADLGKPKRAIHFCIEANWLAHRPYDVEAPRAELAELRRLAAAGSFKHLAKAPLSRKTPVFIVGMPRSGTTLVETILARHPEVQAGGEMLHMHNIEHALLSWARGSKQFTGGPHEVLKQGTADIFGRNAEAVLRHVESTATAPFSVFTDKLPENTQRLGLIASVFPNARIIYVRRHALDCCISNLFQRFSLGHGFAFRQDYLGERYRQVAETMRLWKQSLDLPILDLSYEALVRDPEPSIRRIVDFAGLAWDDACLTPERASRRVMTASQYQVKQPINTNSVDRWRSYEEWIEPLVAALGGLDWVEAEQREIAAATA